MVNGRTDAEGMAARHAARNGEPPLVVEMLENVMNGTFDGINEHGCRMALNEINRLRAAEPRWIPVTERLPEQGVRVLVYDADFRQCEIGDYYADMGWAGSEMLRPTHWMPLPSAPPETKS